MITILTITRHPRKRNIHIDPQLLPSRPIDDNGGLEVDPAVVDEFEEGGEGDDGEGDEGYYDEITASHARVWD